jgi:hypothetical protein
MKILSKGISSTLRKNNLVSTDTTTPTFSNKCIYEVGISYSEKTDFASSIVPSSSLCCELCFATENCLSWSYFMKEQTCHLKSGRFYIRTVDNNAISGYKQNS